VRLEISEQGYQNLLTPPQKHFLHRSHCGTKIGHTQTGSFPFETAEESGKAGGAMEREEERYFAAGDTLQARFSRVRQKEVCKLTSNCRGKVSILLQLDKFYWTFSRAVCLKENRVTLLWWCSLEFLLRLWVASAGRFSNYSRRAAIKTIMQMRFCCYGRINKASEPFIIWRNTLKTPTLKIIVW